MRLEPVPRLPRIPFWAGAAALAWCALAGAEAVLDRRLGLGITTCLFKAVTGRPCPTCGGTRGVLALLAGHPLRALAYNPLLMAAGALAVAWFAFRAATGTEPRLDWTPGRRRAAWMVAATAVLVNWAYLIRMGI